MKKARKYDTSDLTEDQYEPGSQKRVLRNLLGIKRKREMDRLEAREQQRTIEVIVEMFGENDCFTAEDICRIHKIWLGRIYPWAGQYRQVNISKGGFEFAKAMAIPPNMKEFEESFLRKYTPCRYQSLEQIAEALAVVHTELVLIHPFREGNGRIARLLSILMGWQAQLPTWDFSSIASKGKEKYFAAVRAGKARDYRPMEKIFKTIIKKTLKKYPQR
jgi:cell filamentation protein